MKKNKRASIIDVMPFVIILFIFAVILFVGAIVWNDVSQEQGLRGGNTSQSVMETGDLFWENGADSLLVMMYFGMCLVTILTAALVRTNPVFFVISMILWVIITGTLGLVTHEMSEGILLDDTWSDVSDNFPKTKFVMDRIHIAAVVVGLLIMVSMFIGTGRLA